MAKRKNAGEGGTSLEDRKNLEEVNMAQRQSGSHISQTQFDADLLPDENLEPAAVQMFFEGGSISNFSSTMDSFIF